MIENEEPFPFRQICGMLVVIFKGLCERLTWSRAFRQCNMAPMVDQGAEALRGRCTWARIFLGLPPNDSLLHLFRDVDR